MITIGSVAVGLYLAMASLPGEATLVRRPSALVDESIFADGFESGETIAWSLVVGEGLPAGHVCTADEECAPGLLCCYPCGVVGCDNVCTVPIDASCPVLP